MNTTKKKNTKLQNAMIANALLIAADIAYEESEEAKKRFHSITRYIEYTARFDSLCNRFTFHVAQLMKYNTDKAYRKKSSIERQNIKSLQFEIRLIIAFRPDWAETYGVDEDAIQILLAEYK